MQLWSGLPLSIQKKIPHCSPTFPDEFADNVSNKCTFINTKSACYEVSVAFQQLTNNSTRWTSEMQEELKYEQSTGKLYDVLSTCACTSQALWHQTGQSFVTSILRKCHNQISLTTQILTFPGFVLFPWPLQNSLTFPGSRNSRSGNPVWFLPREPSERNENKLTANNAINNSRLYPLPLPGVLITISGTTWRITANRLLQCRLLSLYLYVAQYVKTWGRQQNLK